MVLAKMSKYYSKLVGAISLLIENHYKVYGNHLFTAALFLSLKRTILFIQNLGFKVIERAHIENTPVAVIKSCGSVCYLQRV
jgi:hypothetical protein